jgi:integrase/recombinase XerD
MRHLPVKTPAYCYLEQAFGQWLETLGYSEDTVYQSPNYVRGLLHYLEQKDKTKTEDITRENIRNFYYNDVRQRENTRTKEGGLSSSYLNKYIQALNLFCAYLRQNGRLNIPDLGIRTEEGEKDNTIVLTEEEVRQLYRVCDQYPDDHGCKAEWFYPAMALRDKAMLTVYYGCGLRRTEGLALEISDVLFEKQLLHVRKGKNHKERFVPVSNAGLKHLENYLYDSRPLLIKKQKSESFFISERGRPIGEVMMNLRFRQLVARTNNPVLIEKEPTLHTLRHSIATHLLGNGMKLEKIKEFLGHSSLESTQIYTHLLELEQSQ